MALLAVLSAHFDITLSLHTYEVPGCSLLEQYTHPSREWQPRIRYYDHEKNNQSSLWTAAWQWEMARGLSHDAALVFRFDTGFWHPEALAGNLSHIALGWGRAGSSNDLWLAHPVKFNVIPSDPNPALTIRQYGSSGGSSYFCEAYARKDTNAPFVADALQLVPPSIFSAMTSVFPGHDTPDCLASLGATLRFLDSKGYSPAPEICRNEIYFYVDRYPAKKECDVPSEEKFLHQCAYLAGPRLLEYEKETHEPDMPARVRVEQSTRRLRAILSEQWRGCDSVTGE